MRTLLAIARPQFFRNRHIQETSLLSARITLKHASPADLGSIVSGKSGTCGRRRDERSLSFADRVTVLNYGIVFECACSVPDPNTSVLARASELYHLTAFPHRKVFILTPLT